MRAIHLNYHEIKKDPRVLKECKSLAERGVDVQVICALEDEAADQEQIGKVAVRRIKWMSSSALSQEYLDGLSEFSRSHQLVAERLQPIVHRVCMRRFMTQELGLPPIVSKQDRYRTLRGFSRLKGRLRYLGDLHGYRKAATSNPGFVKLMHDAGLEKLTIKETEKIVERDPKIYHRDVYQAAAFLFDANLRHLTLDGGCDVVHAHDIYTLPAGVRLAKAMGARLVYDAHEYEIARASKMPPEGNGMADAIELDCLEHVDALVTVSEGIAKFYSERFRKRPPDLILNAPEVSDHLWSAAELGTHRAAFRNRLGVGDETPLVSYTGWVLGEQRGVDKVVQALADLPEFHLVVLGPRHERDDGNLMKLADGLGLADRIHLLEPVHHTEVVQTLRNCDIAVIPIQDSSLSYRHAMPNKLFEAVFAGLPVCVADLPDMRAFVERHGRGMATDATDPKAIAQSLESLYRNKKQYALGPDEYKDLLNNYSWRAQAEKLHTLYSQIVSGAVPKTGG